MRLYLRKQARAKIEQNVTYQEGSPAKYIGVIHAAVRRVNRLAGNGARYERKTSAAINTATRENTSSVTRIAHRLAPNTWNARACR